VAEGLYASDIGTDKIYTLNLDTKLEISSVDAPTDVIYGIGGIIDRLYGCDFTTQNLYELDVDSGIILNTTTAPLSNPVGIGGCDDRLYSCDRSGQKVFEIYIDTLLEISSANSPTTSPRGIGGVSDRLYYCTDTANQVFELDLDTKLQISSASLSGGNFGIGGVGDRLYVTKGDEIFELNTDTKLPIGSGVPSPSTSTNGIGGVKSSSLEVITLSNPSKTFNSLTLNWNEVTDTSYYKLRYKKTSESVYTDIITTEPNKSIYGLNSNTSYDIIVESYNSTPELTGTGNLTVSTNISSATITTQNTMRFEGFNESKYENQDLIDMTFNGGDQLILMANCESDLEKYGYNEKFDLWGNLTQEFTAVKKPITLNISDMTDAQHQLLSEHWVAQSPIKIKDDTDKVYHNLLILGKNLGLKENTDVDGDIFWTGTLQLRQI